MSEANGKVMLHLSHIAASTGGVVYGDDVAICGATQDSRKIQAGQLFIALPGANVDGHDYVAMAAQAGAAAAMVARQVDVDIPQVIVADVEQGLQQAAKAWRQSLDTKVLAITGSCGKTTVKQMLAAILSEDGKTLATEGNLNNQLGVPLTVLGITAKHKYAVIEMGASGAGDIELLCDIAAPDVGLITMVAEAHLEGFGSLQGVAEAKGEIYAGLGHAGIAIVNINEPWGDIWNRQSKADLMLSFGDNALADVSVSEQHCEGWLQGTEAGSRFKLNLPTTTVDVALPLPGWHNVMNASAAAAAAVAVSVSAEKIVAGLELAANVSGRLDIQRLANNAALVDDSYNANPASIKAAADWLVSTDIAGQRIMVLGEMAELGEASLNIHRELGETLKAKGVDQLWAVGQNAAKAMAEGFGEQQRHYEHHNLLVTALAASLSPDDVVLVKGSRSAAMEQVAQALTAVMAGRGASQTSPNSGANPHVG
ncbi:MAG: UDP-N-acetylmuramoyl-tripeptide--D-alanyl-D-alanine ligase [Gammaproteobacteria bacterium]|nr:UDP-N-acetylmuramoyl-tripeptide--D-alanyl-D-alanine ligase [Gammaproteobacteria bacterium]